MSIIFQIIICLIQLYNHIIIFLSSIIEQVLVLVSDINFLVFLYSDDFIQVLKNFIVLSLPWIIFLLVIRLFVSLISGARKQKSGVIIVATILQMFMPDPYVERTIKVVQVQTKKQSGSEKQANDENLEG